MQRHQPHRAALHGAFAPALQVALRAQQRPFQKILHPILEDGGVQQTGNGLSIFQPAQLPKAFQQFARLSPAHLGPKLLHGAQPRCQHLKGRKRLPKGGSVRLFQRSKGFSCPLDQRRGNFPQKGQSVAQGGKILRLLQGTEETQHSPHLAVFPEIFPARYHAGNIVVLQTVLDLLQLSMGAAQNGNLRKGAVNRAIRLLMMGFQHVYAARHPFDLLGDEHALGKGILRLHQPDSRAACNVGMKLPGQTGISVNDGQGGFQHRGSRAIVFLQTNQPQIWVPFLQEVETVRIRAAEAVNGLIRVADDKQAALPPVLHQPVLQGIDVLKFIHQQVAEAGFSAFIQPKRFRQKVVQIPSAQPVHPIVVGLPQSRRKARNLHAVFHLRQ